MDSILDFAKSYPTYAFVLGVLAIMLAWLLITRLTGGGKGL